MPVERELPKGVFRATDTVDALAISPNDLVVASPAPCYVY